MNCNINAWLFLHNKRLLILCDTRIYAIIQCYSLIMISGSYSQSRWLSQDNQHVIDFIRFGLYVLSYDVGCLGLIGVRMYLNIKIL